MRRGSVDRLRITRRRPVPLAIVRRAQISLREAATAARGPFWFQLYVIRDRAFIRDLLAQAREAEMRVAMALTGVTHLEAIDRSVLIDETPGAYEPFSREACW